MFKKLVSDIFFLKTNKLIDYQNSLRIILKLKINWLIFAAHTPLIHIINNVNIQSDRKI